MNPQVYDLIGRLRHQVDCPRVTTMGPCAQGCGMSARGSGTCQGCLLKELKTLADPRAVNSYFQSLKAKRRATYRCEDDLERLMLSAMEKGA